MFSRFKLTATLLAITLFTVNAIAQKGKDGSRNYTSGVNILNRYTTPVSSIAAGSKVVTVTNIADLNGSTGFTNSANPYVTDQVGFGDILMLIQVQGADIKTSDDSTYGRVTALNNTGNYELAQVLYVSGNNINLCYGTAHAYGQSGRSKTEVIRVPRLTTLTVAASATVSGLAWNGTIGGVVAIEANNTVTVNGRLSVDTLGFRGGTDVALTSTPNLTTAVSFFRRLTKDSSAGKGESIAGDSSGYAGIGGANGRGAAANGGGGGNCHNTGGGGGSNAGNNNLLVPYNGSGIKDTTGNWDSAWNLESPGFALDSSVGGGRGGYSFGSVDTNAITKGPNLSVWNGDARHNVGGWGGHPLDYSSKNVLFMGGGGGSGEGNNNQWGSGGRGGGILFLLATGSLTGTGTITANGQNGFSTKSLTYGNDAAGGAGGGGAIQLIVSGSISNLSIISANGGNGGSQTINANESEGPGGGGGGGYIAITPNTVTKSVNGGTNGISTSTAVTEFLPNGATKGSQGTIANILFIDNAPSCAPLPVTLVNFKAVKNNNIADIQWDVTSTAEVVSFSVQRSEDGIKWNTFFVGKIDSNNVHHYTTTDDHPEPAMNYYRLQATDIEGKKTLSDVAVLNFGNAENISVFPNPVKNEPLHITSNDIIAHWQITNLSGQVLLSNKETGKNLFINLSALSPAIYLLKTENDGGVTTVFKIIKE